MSKVYKAVIYIDDINDDRYIKSEINISMSENLVIENYHYNSNIFYINNRENP